MMEDLLKAVRLQEDAQPQHIAMVYAGIAFLVARII